MSHIHFIFMGVGPRHPPKRMPWATIFYAFQHHKRGSERLFDTMLFKLMKKGEKIIGYEFNIRLVLIFRK